MLRCSIVCRLTAALGQVEGLRGHADARAASVAEA